jgi:hypothetical protein
MHGLAISIYLRPATNWDDDPSTEFDTNWWTWLVGGA